LKQSVSEKAPYIHQPHYRIFYYFMKYKLSKPNPCKINEINEKLWIKKLKNNIKKGN